MRRADWSVQDQSVGRASWSIQGAQVQILVWSIIISHPITQLLHILDNFAKEIVG